MSVRAMKLNQMREPTVVEPDLVGPVNQADRRSPINPPGSERSPGRRCRLITTSSVLARGAGLWLGLSTALVLAGLMGQPALAAASNDVCSGAEIIPSAGPFPYLTRVQSMVGASVVGDLVSPSCASWVAGSLWYQFTPATTAVYVVSSCADAPTATTLEDTVLAIYSSVNGCAGPFTEVSQLCGFEGCADDICGPGSLQAAVTALLMAGTPYYIVVWRYGDDAEPVPPELGDLQLRVSVASQVPNDTCESAWPLSLDVPVTSNTLGAHNDYEVVFGACFTNRFDEPTPAAGPDVVFLFQAPTDGLYSFKVCNYATVAPNDLVVYLLGACPTGQPPVTISGCLGAANRNPASSAEEISCVPLASNQVVYLVVDDAGCIPGSSFTVAVTRCQPESEPNDSPFNAQPFRCELTGWIATADDADFYALGEPPAGSRLFALVDGEAADRTDFDLRVTTTTDVLEYDDDNNDQAFGHRSPNIAGCPLPGGPVFLRVDYKVLPSGPYRLYAAIQPPLSWAQPEQEPNDSLTQVALHTGPTAGGYFYGALTGRRAGADVDLYQFRARAGELIFVSLDGDPLRDNTPLDARLELLDELGNLWMMVDDPADSSSTISVPGDLRATRPSSPAEGLVWRAPRDGVFWVRVSAGRWALPARAQGDYLLSITRNCPIAWNAPVRLQALQPGNEPGRWKLVGQGGPHLTYLLQETTDFQSWDDVAATNASADGQFEFDLQVESGTWRFYRAVLRP